MKQERCGSAAFACCIVLALGSLEEIAAKRYCGGELWSVMNFLCQEFPSLHDRHKKTEIYFRHLIGDESQTNGDNELHFGVVPFESRSFADWAPHWVQRNPSAYDPSEGDRIVPIRFRRQHFGIIEECCKTDCTMSQLISYCKVVSPSVKAVVTM
ncbi:probable insulin-like peptide 2 [Anopheles bellator]|uniref:probable insulin-like peptide 2 n=1 Tax=Anopheles bellator TaxID=139047 RepID=UPI00264952F8|nr:probable insulin-like peptide 2 [Anopheles bellator]XP_058064826.1 probable insulin-like peptide 2 [Anopheles bellator]